MPPRPAPEPPLQAAGGGKRAKTTTKKPAGADAAEPEPATTKKPAGADAAKSSSRAYDDHRGAKAKSKAKSKAGNVEQVNQQAMTKLLKKNKNDNFVQAMTKQYIGDIMHFTALAMDDLMCENAVARRHGSTYAYSKHMIREGCVACQAQLLCSTRTAYLRTCLS
jgi:hypothetical protein